MAQAVNSEGGNTRTPLLLILGAIAILLALVIVGGTIYSFATDTRHRGRDRREQPLLEGMAVFELGSIRASTADNKPSVVVAVISFPYPVNEREFKEELEKKKPALKAAAKAYFSARRAEELHPAFEGRIKLSLREAFNALLSLGKVDEIWLSDFAVID